MHHENFPTAISPESCLDQILPQTLASLSDPAEPWSETIMIRLIGGRSAVWSIDLASRQIWRGEVEEPDFYLEMDRRDFGAMMLGQLDVDAVVGLGRIRFEGDLCLLERLAFLIERAIQLGQECGDGIKHPRIGD